VRNEKYTFKGEKWILNWKYHTKFDDALNQFWNAFHIHSKMQSSLTGSKKSSVWQAELPPRSRTHLPTTFFT
jgi:hypothetical protein